MPEITTKSVYLARKPEGEPKETDFKVVEEKINTDDLNDGELLLKTLYISVDPYMRVKMADIKGYTGPYSYEKPMEGFGIAKVEQSKREGYTKGDIVFGAEIVWSEYSFASSDSKLSKKENSISPLSVHLNVLGMTGLTAWAGLMEVAQPKKNEIVVVSTAAGAVGYVVGQLAKIHGCKVIAIAGSDEKLKYLKDEFHFDEIINYKKTKNIQESLSDALHRINPENPKIDVYFDNVGGETLNAVLSLLNKYSRVAVCGQSSIYNLKEGEEGVPIKNIVQVLFASATIRGFWVTDYYHRSSEIFAKMGAWLKEGKLKNLENVVEGIENTPKAFVQMMSGLNLGKQIVHVSDP
eukprot:TRINITY_DN5199_c0_g1_i1.p1 TRINITY_DN5199_c0_g1~~TRINITY_DN5199_c0_g1_i1.p1  ORF type:complete len:351 (-),score=102.76 TRINITY_DN5199_c0_g1_i1:64-1116(-)